MYLDVEQFFFNFMVILHIVFVINVPAVCLYFLALPSNMKFYVETKNLWSSWLSKKKLDSAADTG